MANPALIAEIKILIVHMKNWCEICFFIHNYNPKILCIDFLKNEKQVSLACIYSR